MRSSSRAGRRWPFPRRIASPQLGNTQDVQLRAWLAEQGIKVTLTGGDATVVPTENSAQLAQLPVRYMDGRHDNWFNPPEVTSYL